MPKIAIKSLTKNKAYVWGKTTSAHPTFWVYVAYPINSYAEFTLQDEADNEIYQTTFKLDKTPGIIGLNLPPNRVSLETDTSYHWYFNIMCNPENGLWYDTLNTVDRLRQTKPENKAITLLFGVIYYNKLI